MAPSTLAAEMARNKMRDGVERLKHSIVAIRSESDEFRAALRIVRDLEGGPECKPFRRGASCITQLSTH